MTLRELLDYSILGFLVLLSIIVIFISIERMLFYKFLRLSDFGDRRELELELHKRLTLIATIGSNAPYIGLLGTVGGIMLTFMTLSNGDLSDTKEIMSGLAIALKATAMGLLVAVPSIVFYNLLLRKADVILIQWDIKYNPKSGNDEKN
ncbi:MAG: TonB-system energizer ExbB [Helicobacter sp.]|nr:TonB-system energizer ExbB [Helicobacter sp.]